MRDIDQMLFDECLKGNKKYVELALANGANVNAIQDDSGWAILHKYASFNRDLMTGLASQDEVSDILKVLFDNGINVNAKNNHRQTPLYEACVNGNVKYALQLIDQGAEINTKDNYGHTALFDALRLGWVTCVQMLISKGAEFTQEDKDECAKLYKLKQLKSLDGEKEA